MIARQPKAAVAHAGHNTGEEDTQRTVTQASVRKADI
jgi:hypothetical protein